MQASKLVQPNTQRVILSESVVSDSRENQLYVHIKPVVKNIPASIFLRYWKAVSLASLTASVCYALIFKSSFSTQSDNHEVSLASLVEPPAEVDKGDLEDSPEITSEFDATSVVFSGSEYQNRLEYQNKMDSKHSVLNVPAVVLDPKTSSQVFTDFEGKKQSAFKRKTEVTKQFATGQAHGEDLKSMVKFIAGLIAVNRPNISDCGMVAAAIVKLSSTKKVDPFFIAALISVESRFGQNERSNVGATGLMQLMPETATEVADSSRAIRPSLTDVTTNIKLGIDYWKQLEKKYNGNRFLALAAYNWGPGNVDKVRSSPSEIPTSVQKYAKTILERHASWLTHFRNAKLGASGVG